jgi:preprotein translocase subunit SecF
LFNIVSKRKWFFLGSTIVILAGIVSLIAAGLNIGLDFRSGVTMTLLFQDEVGQEELRASFADLGYPEAVIQHSPKDVFWLRGLSANETEGLVEGVEASLDTTVRLSEFPVQGNQTDYALILGRDIESGDLSDELAGLGYTGIEVSADTLDSYLVRIGEPEEEDQAREEIGPSVSEQQRIKTELSSVFGATVYLDYDSISASIAAERVRYTGYAVLVAAVAILLYIAWSFRRLANSFRLGVCAILALVHDVLIVLAIFSLFRIEVNSMFIIAVLTVIGYGVNNIIVVFDRIRENRMRHLNAPYDTMVNISITETLTRSLNTSLTTLLVLLALLLFGGETIRNFVLALTVGVVCATYSSLCIAPELLVSWEWGELGRLFRWIPFRLPRRK